MQVSLGLRINPSALLYQQQRSQNASISLYLYSIWLITVSVLGSNRITILVLLLYSRFVRGRQ